MQRVYAYCVTILVLLTVGLPATWELSEDDYPLSTYPMFARPRGRVSDVTSALAVGRGGARTPVPPSYITNAEVMQAIATLRSTVAEGPAASLALCEAIASRLRDASDEQLRSALRVEIVTGRVDAIDYLGGRATPRTRQLHARCDVRGPQP